MSKIMVPHKSDMSGPCQRESSQATANTAEGRRGRDKRLREKTCMCGTQLGWEGGREKEGYDEQMHARDMNERRFKGEGGRLQALSLTAIES